MLIAMLRWRTIFKQGMNYVKAVAKSHGETLVDSISFYYQTEPFGKPDHILLSETKLLGDTLLITAKVYDKMGIFCPTAKNWITFGITGQGKLIDNLGTGKGSRKIQLSNGKAAIKVIVPGMATISVSGSGILQVFERIDKILRN